MIDDRATLLWCANLAGLELHPFLHRGNALDTPSSVVFDLDPGEGMGIADCARIAILLRDTMARLGLQLFPKVSGSKGIQAYAPLNKKASYASTRRFARGLAERLAGEHPDGIVADMNKNLRKRKVFIDWSQNSDFKTTIGVYSLRAKERPYVSMPVLWEELASHPETLRFEPADALDRLRRIGDLFAPLLTLKQTLPKSAT